MKKVINFSLFIIFCLLFTGAAILISSCKKEAVAPVVCPQGYAGSTCKTQITPAFIQIVGLGIQKFPTKSTNGIPFDLTSAPDVRLALKDDSGNIIWESEIKTDATGTLYFSRLIPLSIGSIKPLKNYRLSLYDDDGITNAPEYMDSIDFSLYDGFNAFTDSITLTSASTTAILKLSYAWK